MTRSPLVLTLALIFGVALAPAAAAQAPAAGTLLTGGSVGTGDNSNGDTATSEIGLRVLRGGRITVRSVSYIPCQGNRTSETSGRGTGRLNPDGTFSVKLPRRQQLRLPGFRRSITVTGRIAGDQATGTTTSASRGAGVRGCRGSVNWVARTRRAVGTDPGPVPAGAALLGSTSRTRGGPFGFNLRVAPDGKRIQQTLVSYRVRCRKAKGYEETNIGPSIAIKADGSFRKVERFVMRYTDANDRWKITITGRFVAGGVRGTLRGTSVVRARGGSRRVIDRCTIGTMRWSATPQ